jgi:hypothetical protein
MDFLYDYVIDEIDDTLARFSLQWNVFEVEDDADGVSFEDDSDTISTQVLIEREDEGSESVTLIVQNKHTNRGGDRMRMNGRFMLGPEFRSKAQAIVQTAELFREYERLSGFGRLESRLLESGLFHGVDGQGR